MAIVTVDIRTVIIITARFSVIATTIFTIVMAIIILGISINKVVSFASVLLWA